MTQSNRFPEDFEKLASLDFANDKSKLIWSYIIRLIGVIVFAVIFALIAKWFHPDIIFQKDAFLNIALKNSSRWFSIILIICDVLLVLYLHELIHASVFYFSVGAKPKIGIRGPIIYAAAPDFQNKRNMMIVNALAPFTIISILGLILMAVLPTSVLPWIFIPAVVNAASSGGDFMAVAWLLKLDKDVVLEDDGDVLTAYRKIIS